MSELYSEDEIVATVTRLTRVRLVSYVEADIIRPMRTRSGPRFRPVDIARLELLCDLAEEFDLDEEALGMVVSLIDQLHDARSDLEALAEIIADEPYDVRLRIGEALARRRR